MDSKTSVKYANQYAGLTRPESKSGRICSSAPNSPLPMQDADQYYGRSLDKVDRINSSNSDTLMCSEQYAGVTPLGYFPEQNTEWFRTRQDDKILQPPPLDVGERVVWFSDIGNIEKATVRWIGILPDDVNAINGWVAGVEFDNRIGSGTGMYKNTQLFQAPKGHASLIPITGLMKESDLETN